MFLLIGNRCSHSEMEWMMTRCDKVKGYGKLYYYGRQESCGVREGARFVELPSLVIKLINQMNLVVHFPAVVS